MKETNVQRGKQAADPGACLDFLGCFEYSVSTLLTHHAKKRSRHTQRWYCRSSRSIESYHQRSVKHVRKAFVVLVLAALSGCEENPSTVPDLTGTAPVVETSSASPLVFDLNALASQAGVYHLSAYVSASVSDPQGLADVHDVRWTVYPPSGGAALTSGALTAGAVSGSGLAREYYASVTFDVTRAAMGTYRIEMVATDGSGFHSTATSIALLVRTGTSAPVLSLAGARQVNAAGDSTLFLLTVTALDSNGLGDISAVSVRARASRDSSSTRLYDDGSRAHGDAVAGDGIFSGLRWVRPTTVVSSILFEYRASDAGGMQSNILLRSANNEAPVFTALNVPSTITRPTSGSTLISFFAAVTDANGRSDIDSVYFVNLSSTTPTAILMYDDGDLTTHGDSVAADGMWSRRLSIDASTSTGAKTFRFSATDRAGARKDTTRIITIN
jgi:hypothetical protein